MLEERTVYLNGEFVPWDQATVHVMCHSMGRGSAIFEVISIHQTVTGSAVFRLDRHIERLFRSAELLDMELPLSASAFQAAVIEAVKTNGVSQGFVKIVCFYPQVSFGIMPPQKMLDVSIFVVDPAQDLEEMAFPLETGTTACISTWRKLDPATVPVEAKAAANYLNGMMARGEARERGFEQVIMLDTQGFVAEGGTESVFLVKDGGLLTPALGTVLQSISRRSVLELAEVLGIQSVQAKLRPELIFEADEVFFSGTPIKVFPVRQVDDRVMGEVPGPVTRELSARMSEIVTGRDDRFADWLFPVG